MKNLLLRFRVAFALIAGVVFMAGCGSISPETGAKIESRTKLYTQVGMWYDVKKRAQGGRGDELQCRDLYSGQLGGHLCGGGQRGCHL